MLTWAICWMMQSIYKEAIRDGRSIEGDAGGCILVFSIAGDIALVFVALAFVSTLVGGA